MTVKNSAALAAILLLSVAPPGSAEPSPEESLVRLCTGAALFAEVLEESDPFPRVAGESRAVSDSEFYWRYIYNGASIPIPTEEEDWYFFLSGEGAAGEYGVLDNASHGLRYVLQPAPESDAIRAIAEQIESVGFPATDLAPIALLELAISIDPSSVACDTTDVRATVDNTAALFVRSNASSLAHHDVIYLHNDGLLGYSNSEDAVSWTYVFPSRKQGALSFVKVSSTAPEVHSNLGFRLGIDHVLEAGDAPPWMTLFFDFLEAPTQSSLLVLRQAAATYSFREDVLQGIDRRLAEFRRHPE